MFRSDHGSLIGAADALLEPLANFRDLVVPGGVQHMQHDDFAERALSLSLYLRSALDLAGQDQYLPAFAVIRSSLEHHLTDRLLFLAHRYLQFFEKVSKATYEGLLADWKKQAPGTENIIDMSWESGHLKVTRRGLQVSGPGGEVGKRSLSVYYFVLRDFDPFLGHPAEQKHLARGFTPVETRVSEGSRQQKLYSKTLRWPAIKDNLSLNGLCGKEVLRRFEVHYRFLSAFVHPMPAAYDMVYGRDRPSGAPRYDHYSSELILLYVVKIASEELKALKRMSRRQPAMRLAGWEEVDARIRLGDELAQHLWFPGDAPPHSYDFVEEANSRAMRGERMVACDQRPSPEGLKVTQVRYYRNPLLRLIKMHGSFQEITGFAYRSPWPRPDAVLR